MARAGINGTYRRFMKKDPAFLRRGGMLQPCRPCRASFRGAIGILPEISGAAPLFIVERSTVNLWNVCRPSWTRRRRQGRR